jgi:hypothetical protein
MNGTKIDISVITKIELMAKSNMKAILITNDPHLLRLSLPGYKVKKIV